jgi:membrane-associated PAP2 superfamily phosphatase
LTLLNRHFYISLGALAITLALFHFFPIDFWVQDNFYDFSAKHWIVDERNETLRWWFYDFPKVILILLGVSAIGTLTAGFFFSRARAYRTHSICFILALALVPTLVGLGKKLTNMHCPGELTHYSGTTPYVDLFERCQVRCDERGQCFPAGHASGGFALFILYFLLRKRRWIGAAVGFGYGWTMGLYQMLKGAHFLSHTLVSMLFAWWLVWIIYWIIFESKLRFTKSLL